MGIAKINYGTCLKQSYLTAIRKALDSEEVDPHMLLGFGGREDVLAAARIAVRESVIERMEVLGCCGRA